MRGFRAGLTHLAANCKYMRCAFAEYGHPKSRNRQPGFATLARIIVDQQVSVQAGAAIWRRLEERLGSVSAVTVVNAGIDPLRESGLSGAKATYVHGIASLITAGDFDLDGLGRFQNKTAHEKLVALKGVGRWTADIYLMFALGRPDILPVGDIALQAAAGRLLGLNDRPSPGALEEIGERWRPYRTTASVALWHFYKKMPVQN